MNSFVISSGHSLKVRGASCSKFQMDEVDEARIVTEKVASYLKQLNATVHTFHDNTSTTQSRNIDTIVKFHNSKIRDLDISTHFNASSITDSARGTEVLYVNDKYKELAEKLSSAIAVAGGFKNRGAKKRTDLGFLNGTKKPALLIEICFVDSKVDAELYQANVDKICKAIAETLTGKQLKVFTTSSSLSTKLYRLETDMFSSKPFAEKIQTLIKEKLGYVVHLKEKDGKFYLMTGTFRRLDDVVVARGKVKDLGYISFVKEVK